MERRIIQKFNENVNDLKSILLEEFKHETVTMAQLVELVTNYTPPVLNRDDFIKRRRTKNSVPPEERCIAKSAKNDQCSRRRKTGHLYCGTHNKGLPHGLITATDDELVQKDVWAEDINGIIYYIDADNNIYKTEDIMKNIPNPQILATWSKNDGGYTIHWQGKKNEI